MCGESGRWMRGVGGILRFEVELGGFFLSLLFLLSLL
jgi:hypothetical protein